jgi:uncharacterized membrane protein (DUF106 family)
MAFGLLPYQELLIFSIGLSVLMALLTKFLTNQKELKNVKHTMKVMREKISKAQKSGDTKEMSRLNSEMLKVSQKQFRENMKPMFISLFIFVFALGWFASRYEDLSLSLPFVLPLLVPSFPPIEFSSVLNWFWWYLILVIPSSMAVRKLLDIS